MTDDMKIRWIVVICRERAVEVQTFSDEGSAREWEERWGKQWSESFVCRVVKGPLTCSDPEPSSFDVEVERLAAAMWEVRHKTEWSRATDPHRKWMINEARAVADKLTPRQAARELSPLGLVVDWLESKDLRAKLHAWAQEHCRGRSETDTITDVLPVLADLLRDGIGAPIRRVSRPAALDWQAPGTESGCVGTLGASGGFWGPSSTEDD